MRVQKGQEIGHRGESRKGRSWVTEGFKWNKVSEWVTEGAREMSAKRSGTGSLGEVGDIDWCGQEVGHCWKVKEVRGKK